MKLALQLLISSYVDKTFIWLIGLAFGYNKLYLNNVIMKYLNLASSQASIPVVSA